MNTTAAIEKEIHELARALYRKAGEHKPTLFEPQDWIGRMIDWSLEDESLRVAYTHQPGQEHVKRVVCEMGGKNAIIVDGDADLDEAVAIANRSSYALTGGPDYLLQFLEPRTISENTLRHGFVPPEELNGS